MKKVLGLVVLIAISLSVFSQSMEDYTSKTVDFAKLKTQSFIIEGNLINGAPNKSTFVFSPSVDGSYTASLEVHSVDLKMFFKEHKSSMPDFKNIKYESVKDGNLLNIFVEDLDLGDVSYFFIVSDLNNKLKYYTIKVGGVELKMTDISVIQLPEWTKN